MIPGRFDYHRPGTVADVVALLSRHGEDCRLVAGGHSLIPMMKLRLAAPDHLIDLQAVDGLKAIEVGAERARLGAMVTQHEMIAAAAVGARLPILKEAALQIADPQVRYCGTIGGNVANGDPGNDLPAVMLALGAGYEVQGPAGTRLVEARGFYEAAYFTALGEGEVLTAIHIPLPPVGHGYAYEKQKRKIGDYATAAAAVVVTVDAGRCTSAAIALTNVADTPLSAADAAALLVGTALDDGAIARAAAAAASITSPAGDGRGPAEFRSHVARIMVERALARARERAT